MNFKLSVLVDLGAGESSWFEHSREISNTEAALHILFTQEYGSDLVLFVWQIYIYTF